MGTSGGSIHLAKLKGTIRATTSGGNVGGSNVDGELFAHTSGGNIDLQEIAGNLEASTSGGHISADLVSLKDFVRLQGSGGNISIQVPANKGLDLKLSGDKIKTGNLQGFNGSIDDHSVNGKLNGGGTAITVDAGNGKVSLTLK